MTKDRLPHFLIILITVIVDQYSKFVVNTQDNKTLINSFLFIKKAYNYGLANSTLAENDLTVIAVFSTLLFLLVLIIYLITNDLLSQRLIGFRIGLTLIFSGCLSNLIDRLQNGHVLDFISIELFDMTLPALNVADIVQWPGYFIVLYYLIFKGSVLFKIDEKRKISLINKSFQYKLCFYFFIVSTISFIACSTLCYIVIPDLTMSRVSTLTVEEIILYKRFIFLSLTTLYFIIHISLIYWAIKYTNRIAGPLYSFNRYILNLERDNGSEVFTLRSKDEFKFLEPLALYIKDKFYRK